MIDVKKLITGFLILAGAAVCSGAVLSFINFNSAPAAAPQIGISSSTDAGQESAFLPDEPSADAGQYLSTSTLEATSANPNNLTDVLATAFVNSVADANPNGPVNDNGNSIIAHPDETAIADEVASVPGVADITVPNWDIEAGSQPIKTTAGSSEEDISNYSQSLSQVVNTNLVATNVQNIINNQNPDPTQVGFVETQMQQTLGQTLALPTPKALVPFQESLVKVMVYEKNELALANNVGDDPVKAALILQDEQSKYNAALQALNAQIEKDSSLQGFSFGAGSQDSEGRALTFFNSALGIQTAHAQWLTFDASNFGEWIENFVNNIVLQILKNVLTALIQRKVLTWIQGSGAPRFITNWGETLVNAYEQTAINALNSQISCGVFPAYIPQIRLTLGASYNSTNNVCANQFQAALGSNSLQQFYNNFQNGGFVAFGASTLPSGNPYGSLFFNAQIISYTAQNAQTAALAKATASQGQKGDEVCDDNSDPNNGEHTVCENPDGPDYTISGKEQCGPGDTPVVYANDGVCSDGTEPNVTTPGVYTAFAVNSAIDASPKLVTAANDISGLLNALLGSLLNSLASLAVNTATNGVNNALNGGVSGIQASSISGGSGTTTAKNVPLACNPITQTVSSTFPVTIGAVGGQNDANGNPPIYSWSSSDGQTNTGYTFSPTYNLPGTYTVTITDNTGDAPATCTVVAK